MTPASTNVSAQARSKNGPAASDTGGAGRRVIGGVAALVSLAAVVGLLLSGGSYQPLPEGLPDSGPVVGWGLPILSGLTFVAAFATIGWLLFASFLDAKAKSKIVSKGGRKALVRASGAAVVWAILLLVTAWFTLAQILGIDLVSTLDPGVISTYWWDAVVVRALVVGALFAVIVAIGAAFTIRLATATLWLVVALVAVALPALTGHAAGLGDHSLAIMNGVGHSVAATLWIGGLIALAIAVSSSSIEAAVRRFSLIAMTCVIILAGTGIGNTYTRLGAWSDLWASGYGRLAVIKTILLIALVWLGFNMRKRIITGFVDGGPKDQLRRAFAKLASLELLLMALTAGFGVALSMTPPTRATIQFPTQAEELLGFEFPEPPTPMDVVFGISVDSVFLVLSLAGIFFYLAGVRRLYKRGDSWPIGRTILWIVGCLIVLWATNSSISMYASMSVGLHMIQHMTLTMLAPIGLVMGAPITLALRALKSSPTGGRGLREIIVESIHSWPGKIITNPAVVLFIYVIGLYGLYFTPLFGTLMSNHVGHIFMTLHFIVAGFLLTWVAIGIDPQPKPLPYWGKMILVIAAVTLHAFFSIALMSTKSGIGESWYGKVRPPWLADPVQDSLMGGQIAWGIAEVPTLIILCIIGVQWWRADDRAAKRRDRHVEQHGDKELDDYNAYLEALAKNDQKHGR
ncbi:MAG: cytochrome c oxidase assembly protein [Candidatus Nanopelagicales bacterium]